MKFRKKPIVIEAIQLTHESVDQVTDFMKIPPFNFKKGMLSITIHSLEGVMTAQLGDWIIKGVKGEFYSCKPDVFEMTYEKVPEGPATAGVAGEG